MSNIYSTVIENYDYCIILDCCTLACCFTELKKMNFKTNYIIVDQIFYTGNSDTRFAFFKVENGVIDIKTMKFIRLPKNNISIIDKLVFEKYRKLCKNYLSYSDFRYFSSLC